MHDGITKSRHLVVPEQPLQLFHLLRRKYVFHLLMREKVMVCRLEARDNSLFESMDIRTYLVHSKRYSIKTYLANQ